jgi:hypothetical protein
VQIRKTYKYKVMTWPDDHTEIVWEGTCLQKMTSLDLAAIILEVAKERDKEGSRSQASRLRWLAAAITHDRGYVEVSDEGTIWEKDECPQSCKSH